MLLSIIKEYGIVWLFNRSLYCLKLKTMGFFPFTERLYEKKFSYPIRIDLFEINSDQLRKFLDSLSESNKKTIIDKADSAIEGKLIGFSNMELNYGQPIDWQINPLTGQKCSIFKKWYQIPDFDEIRGDIKLVWEASRFSHFILFVRAFYLTKNRKYYDAFKNQLSDWLQKNPYSYGANYKCSQECSIRLANALLTYSAFSVAGCCDNEIIVLIKELVYRTYRKILSNFFYAYKCIKNDHTFSELMGMMIGAWCCNDGKRLKWSGKVLNEVICQQFTEDGGYKSFSFNYEREIFQDLECILSISNKTGFVLSDDSVKRLINAVLLLYQCQSEDGQLPNYGDNDGTLIFQLSSCKFSDFRASLNTMYALLMDKELYEKGIHQEELIWFSKGKKINEYSKECEKRISSSYPQAGIFTIRDRCTWAMIILNDYKTRAGHMDQLHFDLWIDDINVLCDAGTYSYVDPEGKKFKDNCLHNTVKIKDLSQMKTYGAFMVFDKTQRKSFSSKDKSFQGKIFSPNGYSHCRAINYEEGGYDIIDTVSGKNGTIFYVLFHTPCDIDFVGNIVELSYENKKLCEITSDLPIKLYTSQRSLSYLHKEDTKCICITGVIGETITVCTRIKLVGGNN